MSYASDIQPLQHAHGERSGCRRCRWTLYLWELPGMQQQHARVTPLGRVLVPKDGGQPLNRRHCPPQIAGALPHKWQTSDQAWRCDDDLLRQGAMPVESIGSSSSVR